MFHDRHSWLQSPLGLYLQEKEQPLYDAAVADIFGFNAVQLGMLELDLLQASRMPFVFGADAAAGLVRCQSAQLPFQTASIDLLLLPHMLEFSVDPHQTLRDAGRVLVPEGHIIISGFNPFSSWGLKRLLSRSKGYPWQGTFFSLPRIRDWLELLDFEIVEVRTACYKLPLSNPTWLKRCRFMDRAGGRWWPMTGGIYFIVARKRVLGMRVIRPGRNHSRLKSLMAVPTRTQPTQHNKRKDCSK
ncbi:MAG: methyltransferase domain-containing protein [Methylophilaceae bacterium]|nr:methyltransferase domain-containing protein [Methylophilaceae bacterium]